MILLCVGVLMQMLGPPITLWDPAETADSTDPLTISILEDFSIPSAPTSLSLLLYRLLSTDIQSSLHGFLLVSGLFHPPNL
jgi:hypothetical protein